MTDIIGSIIIGISLVAVWATIHGGMNWLGSKIESYRHAKYKNSALSFIQYILRRKKR